MVVKVVLATPWGPSVHVVRVVHGGLNVPSWQLLTLLRPATQSSMAQWPSKFSKCQIRWPSILSCCSNHSAFLIAAGAAATFKVLLDPLEMECLATFSA